MNPPQKPWREYLARFQAGQRGLDLDPKLQNVWSCDCGRATDIPFEVFPNICPACGRDVREKR